MSNMSIFLYVIAGIIFLLPDFYAGWRFEKGIESDLVEESDSFKGISKLYRNYAFIWSIFSCFLVYVIWQIIKDGSGPNMEVVMPFIVVIITSCATILSGIIAIQRNVYPISKYYGSKTSFAYDYDGNVKKYGRMVTTIAGSISIIALIVIVVIRFFT
jgi:hypothetical protein